MLIKLQKRITIKKKTIEKVKKQNAIKIKKILNKFNEKNIKTIVFVKNIITNKTSKKIIDLKQIFVVIIYFKLKKRNKFSKSKSFNTKFITINLLKIVFIETRNSFLVIFIVEKK